MKNINIDELENTIGLSADRRLFFKALALGSAGLVLSSVPFSVSAQQKGPDQPEAESGHDYPMPRPDAKTEADFRNGVIGPASLSLIVSEMAVSKATNAKALEFAKFELREAIGVTTVLKGLGTVVPPMDASAIATLKKIKNAKKGVEFDKAYIKAQLSNHEFLRDLATSYLANSTGASLVEEMHGRNLAMLALGQFKDHVVLTKDIMKMLG